MIVASDNGLIKAVQLGTLAVALAPRLPHAPPPQAPPAAAASALPPAVAFLQRRGADDHIYAACSDGRLARLTLPPPATPLPALEVLAQPAASCVSLEVDAAAK